MYSTAKKQMDRNRMSQELIPLNEEKAASLEQKLANTFYRDPKSFIQIYNSGVINRSNDEVKTILERILSTYKGIEKRGQEITFLSTNEISVEEILVSANAYRALLQIKRILRDAIAEEHITENESVNINKNGVITKVGEEEIEELPGVKHGSLSNEATKKLRNLLEVDEEASEYEINVHTVLNVNEDAVTEGARYLHL